jgi:hypothetical protein
MAIALACVAVVQLGWPTVVRPHLIPPATSTSTVSVSLSTAAMGHNGQLTAPVTGRPGAWIRPPTARSVSAICEDQAPPAVTTMSVTKPADSPSRTPQ